MDTERIAAILKVLEAGSLSAAAEQLGYTVSGLSRQISSLEQETGLVLLHREHRGVSPTPACRELLGPMRQMLAAEEHYRQRAAALRGMELGTLRIGCAYDSYFPYLSAMVAQFSSAHPNIRVEIFEGSSSEMSTAVREGRADFAVISRREGEFDWIPLCKDALMAVLPLRHSLCHEKEYPVARFETDDFIEILPQRETDNSRMFKSLGLRPRTRFTCNDSLAALSMVEAGLGVTLVNALILENWQGKAAILPLDPPHQVEIGIAILSCAEASPASTSFLELLPTPDKTDMRLALGKYREM